MGEKKKYWEKKYFWGKETNTKRISKKLSWGKKASIYKNNEIVFELRYNNK